MLRPLRLFFGFILITLMLGCQSAPTTTSLAGPTLVRATNTLPVRPATETPPREDSVNPLVVKATATPSRIASPTSKPGAPVRPGSGTPTPRKPSPSPTRPLPTPTTSTPTPTPVNWQDLPVIPTIRDRVIDIYWKGVDAGNQPTAFSKIGDCGSTPAWFLGDFDRGPGFYRLGEYKSLETVIQIFQGSFDRTSLAARSGFNASALFVPLWADRTYCNSNEAPLACEYRVWRPSIAFIMLGTNDVWKPDEFEPQMRKIIEFSIENGVVPILSTKADNTEGDGEINAAIARLAQEYEIPLWNFWAAVQDLPGGGLQEDKAHLTWGRNFFDDPYAMTNAWPVRNLTALQVLNAVWEKISSPK